MGKFLTSLKVEQVAEATTTSPAMWRLTDPLIYESSKLGLIIVDRDTITNFASVPRLPISYWLFGGRSNAPAALHDCLYSPGHNTGRGVKVTRLQADNLIFEASVDSLPGDAYSFASIVKRQIVYVMAGLIWAGVRLFGTSHWKD